MPELERLNRFLARNGIASRRKCDELIQAGAVLVDGAAITELGARIDPSRNRVEVNGRVLRPEGEEKHHYILNKPKGVICTNDPMEGRRRAIDLITDRKKGRIYSVGRLDEETEGLIILTNDGEFANRIGHPRYKVSKTYRVTVKGRIETPTLEKLRRGVHLSEGKARVDDAQVEKRSDHRSIIDVVLHEGKNRIIRRIFAHVGLPVLSLKRTRVGTLSVRGLPSGAWRRLKPHEIASLLAGEDPGQRRTSARGQKGLRNKSGQPRRTNQRSRSGHSSGSATGRNLGRKAGSARGRATSRSRGQSSVTLHGEERQTWEGKQTGGSTPGKGIGAASRSRSSSASHTVSRSATSPRRRKA